MSPFTMVLIDDTAHFETNRFLSLVFGQIGVFDTVEIKRQPNQRPVIQRPEGFEFSISRSKNLCLGLVSRAGFVGIDLEFHDQARNFAVISEQFYSLAEQEILKNSPHPIMDFYDLWTAKEARVKRLGLTVFEVGDILTQIDPGESLLRGRIVNRHDLSEQYSFAFNYIKTPQMQLGQKDLIVNKTDNYIIEIFP